MERTDSHRDESETTPKESPRRDEVEIIFTFGPPGSAAARDACRAVATRDDVDADQAWNRVAHAVLDAMNEPGPDGCSEFDRIASVHLRTPVFVFGAVPSRCYTGGSVHPTLDFDATRVVDHYGNQVPGRRFSGKVVKGLMASIAHALESDWARAALITNPVSSTAPAADDANHDLLAEDDEAPRVLTDAELAALLLEAARKHGWGEFAKEDCGGSDPEEHQ